MKITQKKVEIFCGTGGVGKTTIATARALALAIAGKKVLLITIDPAKRLKQILNLDDNLSGEVSVVSADLFNLTTPIYFHAMLMSPGATLKKISKLKGLEDEFKTSIISTLSQPNGGMNEIMSIVEVQFQLEKQEYDTIILDTPPGKHFIDFLQASEKIKNFFDKSFLEVFEFLGKKVSTKSKPIGIFNKLISTGLSKLLSFLENVTGADFVQEFIDTVHALYKSRDIFLKALSFQEDLKKQGFSNWFLVTSVDQQKTHEASELSDLASKFLHADNYLIINKCLLSKLNAWAPDSEELYKLKLTYIEKENLIEKYSSEHFKKIIKLQEIIESKPIEHVKQLAVEFEKYI